MHEERDEMGGACTLDNATSRTVLLIAMLSWGLGALTARSVAQEIPAPKPGPPSIEE